MKILLYVAITLIFVIRAIMAGVSPWPGLIGFLVLFTIGAIVVWNGKE